MRFRNLRLRELVQTVQYCDSALNPLPLKRIDMIQLREALEASWDINTAYQGVFDARNPALGQCYPTSRVIQLFFPETEIVEGEVWTGKSTEKHFWNLFCSNGIECHIDFTWQQFPKGSIVKHWKTRDRNTMGDGTHTIARVECLHTRVKNYLSRKGRGGASP